MRPGRIVLYSVCAVALILIAAFGVSAWHADRTTSHNRARARAAALSDARDFAEQVRAGAQHGPLTPAKVQALGRAGRVGLVEAERVGSHIVVTFDAVESYAVVGGVAPGEVDLCFSETISRSGGTARDVLKPLDCAHRLTPVPAGRT